MQRNRPSASEEDNSERRPSLGRKTVSASEATQQPQPQFSSSSDEASSGRCQPEYSPCSSTQYCGGDVDIDDSVFADLPTTPQSPTQSQTKSSSGVERDIAMAHRSEDSGVAAVSPTSPLEPMQVARSSLLMRRRRRRTKSEEVAPAPPPGATATAATCGTGSRLASLREDLRAFVGHQRQRLSLAAGPNRPAHNSCSSSSGGSRRQRNQSIAEEGEYEIEDRRPHGAHQNEQQQHQQQQQQQRSTVKQFFLDSIRPRAKSENAQTMTRPKPPRSAVGGTTTASPPGASPRSPIGGLVSRLRHLAASDGDRQHQHRRAGSSGQQQRQLPHPSMMPLDCAHHAEVCENRVRKSQTITMDGAYQRDAELYSPLPGFIQERHRDLFENLSHTPDSEGQCSIQSPAALAESRSHWYNSFGHSHGMSSGQPPLVSPSSGSGHHPPARQRTQSGAEVQVTENEKYIIFRSRCQNDCSSVDMDEVRTESLGDPSRVFAIFVQKHRCYDLIPTSSKLLVFDNSLNVRKAFFALVYNGLRAAPLWDAQQQRFVGMLTISDFIHILHNYYRSALVPMEELETHRISTWRAELSNRLKPLIWISPEASLLDAVRLLLQARVHRLPVIDPATGNALFIVTHKRILKYIFLYIHQLPMPAWLARPVRQLSIGTYSNIVTVGESTPLVRVLNLFVQNRVSALPVVDGNGRLVDIYSKFDVINLAATKTYNNLDISVKEALQYRRDRFEGVSSCRAEDSLKSVIQKLVTAEVHRLVVTDSEGRVAGLVSLSDVLKALIIDCDTFGCCSGGDGGFGDSTTVNIDADNDGAFAPTEPMDMS